MSYPQTRRCEACNPNISPCNRGRQGDNGPVTAGHNSKLADSAQPIIIGEWDAFEGRRLRVAFVDEVFILVVTGSEAGAEKNEWALCADHMRLNFQVGVLAIGDGGLGAVEGVEGHGRWVSNPEGDLHGMVGPRFG